ncbi:MAG: hypothetical protein IH807_06560, partial [Proteobacteria bacterium]|nr:hypothetical protein [Pseudomonadota bacterium]
MQLQLALVCDHAEQTPEGKLDLKGNTKQYVDYVATSNADSQQVGAVRFKVTPNYTGAPSTDTQFLFSISQAEGNVNNHLAVHHDITSGNLRIAMNDQAGVSNTVILGAWSPVAGVEVEFELNYDFNGGAQRLFLDGVQLGSTAT